MPEAGWYPDPQQAGLQRYWDGMTWTAHTAPAATTRGSVTPAGFWIRFLAVVLDGLIVGIPTSMITYAINPDQYQFGGGYGYNPGLDGVANLIGTLIGMCYYGFLEGSSSGQTLGKRVCGIRVVDATTYAPGVGVGRAIGRYFARWLSALPLLLGYFWMLWDDNRQTWHDKLTNVLVVRD